MKLLDHVTALRLTYNTMIAPELAATTIALGDSGEARPMPHGAGARTPAALFVTVTAAGAIVIDAATGTPVVVLATAVDPLRRQVEAHVPFDVFDPRGRAAVRMAAASGIWDPATATYPAGLYNAAFRTAEPRSGWRTVHQASALAAGDLTGLHAHVDFTRLAAGVTDESAVPYTGFSNRIFASAHEPQQGRSGDNGRRAGCPSPCVVQYAGQLQPYSVYVPQRPPPPGGWPLTVDLHGCGQTHNIGFRAWRTLQLGERWNGSVVLTPLARGDCYWYLGPAAVDVFEAWADIARQVPLDPDGTTIVGTSMGGYGALRLAAAWPDLFARAAAIVPCTGAGIEQAGTRAVPGGSARTLPGLLPALRHVPVMLWQTTADTTCEYRRQLQMLGRLDAMGYRYRALTFGGIDHVTLAAAALDDAAPVAEFLGAARRPADPAQVTFVTSTALGEPALGLAADHAYWLSEVVPLDPAQPGRIDVVSQGLGVADRGPGEPQHTGGALANGLAYTAVERLADGRRPRPSRRSLRIVASGIRSVTVDARRARTGCDPGIDIRSYGLLALHLDGCNTTYHLKRVCHGTAVFDLHPGRLRRGARRTVSVRFRGAALRVGSRRVRIRTGGDPRAVARLRTDVLELSGRRRVRLTLHHYCPPD